MPPSAQFPLRVRYAGTDPVHGARSKTSGRTAGYVTACWLWLHPSDPHTWCAEDVEVTCIKCIERMGPTVSEYSIPGTVGTLQQRLAEVIENEVPPGVGDLPARRVTEVVEEWRQEVEQRVRLTVESELADLLQEPIRSTTASALVEKVLMSMDVGSSTTSEEGEK